MLMSLHCESISVDLPREEVDLHQEDAIGETSECVHLPVAIWKSLAGRPFTHHSCAQTHDQCKAVKEHMYTITKEAQRSCHQPIECLDEHETEIKAANNVSNRDIEMSVSKSYHIK